jgi:hypothetical protein
MRGNSFKDIRKINPFLHGDESLFVKAVRSGNVELANLILDKALKLNPIQTLFSGTLYAERTFFAMVEVLEEIVERTAHNSNINSLQERLERIIAQERIFRRLTFRILWASTVFMALINLRNQLRNRW